MAASPTSRSLALTLALFGLGLVVNVVGFAHVIDLSPALQSRIHSILACGAVIAGFEWILRIGRTEAADGSAPAPHEPLLRAAEALISQPTAIAKVPESERVDARRMAEDIAAAGTPARWMEGPDAIVALLAREARPGDVILAMSNGGFGGLHKKLLDALAAR